MHLPRRRRDVTDGRVTSPAIDNYQLDRQLRRGPVQQAQDLVQLEAIRPLAEQAARRLQATGKRGVHVVSP